MGLGISAGLHCQGLGLAALVLSKGLEVLAGLVLLHRLGPLPSLTLLKVWGSRWLLLLRLGSCWASDVTYGLGFQAILTLPMGLGVSAGFSTLPQGFGGLWAGFLTLPKAGVSAGLTLPKGLGSQGWLDATSKGLGVSAGLTLPKGLGSLMMASDVTYGLGPSLADVTQGPGVSAGLDVTRVGWGS